MLRCLDEEPLAAFSPQLIIRCDAANTQVSVW
jgi:hypothetical protein